MKKIYLLIVLIGVVFTSCNQQKDTIVADIKGLGNDTVLVTYIPLSNMVSRSIDVSKDTVVAVDGKFTYNLANDTMMVSFEPKSLIKMAGGRKQASELRKISLLVKPSEKIQISGSIVNGYIDYDVNTGYNSDYSSQRKSFLNEYKVVDSINLLAIGYYLNNQGGENDSILNILGEEYTTATKDLNNKILDYAKSNLNKDLAGFYLTNQPMDTFNLYYPKLGVPVQNGIYKNLFESRINAYAERKILQENKEKIVVGADAPDFTLKDVNGNDVSLQDLKGKYLVLDFWGSWCGWCVKGYPKMKEYYNKYNEKMEIVGIACNDKDDAWRKAIEENELNWTQLFNEKETAKNVSVMYGVSGYPTKIIVDKDLKIAEVSVGETEAFYTKLDELLK